MFCFNPHVAVLAADFVQQAAIGIIFAICLCLMLVPIVAVGIFAFVELRACRRVRRSRARNASSVAGSPMGPRPSVVAPRGEVT
jgi:hypothetical protein